MRPFISSFFIVATLDGMIDAPDESDGAEKPRGIGCALIWRAAMTASKVIAARNIVALAPAAQNEVENT
ncbi:hypothetical protein [Methylosinus sporium]|uniref:hypothetical protein n=1 Tax=Methylosinus sporium TaxID=428 RepID=UPI00383AC456